MSQMGAADVHTGAAEACSRGCQEGCIRWLLHSTIDSSHLPAKPDRCALWWNDDCSMLHS